MPAKLLLSCHRVGYDLIPGPRRNTLHIWKSNAFLGGSLGGSLGYHGLDGVFLHD